MTCPPETSASDPPQWRGAERRHDRAAEAMRRLLIEGFKAPTPIAAAVVVGQVVAEHLGTDRNAVIFFADTAREDIQVVTAGVPDDVDRAVRRSVEHLKGMPERSAGWRNAMATVNVEVVADADHGDLRPGGVVRTLGMGAFVGLPLVGPDGPNGRLLCGVRHRRRWRDHEVDDAMRLAMAGAAVIEAARRGEAERRLRRELEYRADHDSLTGLLNRDAFSHRLDQATRQRGGDAQLAVLLLDLDRFKKVNDTLGHHAGDRLLCLATERLRHCVRAEDVIARLGGDEFAVAIDLDPAGAVAERTAWRIVAALSEPFQLGDQVASVAASIGLAIFPRHGDDETTLLAHADIAMYEAKRRGASVVVYSR